MPNTPAVNPIINEATRVQLLNQLAALRALQPELNRAAAAGFDVTAHQARLTDAITRLNAIYNEYFAKSAT